MSKDHDDHDEDNDDYGTTTNTRSLTETDFSAVGEHTDAGDEHTDAVDGHIESDTVDEHNNTGGGCTNILKESATLTTGDLSIILSYNINVATYSKYISACKNICIYDQIHSYNHFVHHTIASIAIISTF